VLDIKMEKSKWENYERLLLILTFICTVLSTSYAIFTSNKALHQASIALRPWVIIEKTVTDLYDDGMVIRFKVSNIGDIPTYVTYKTDATLNGIIISNKNDNEDDIIISLMPEQTAYPHSLTIKGEIYQQIMKKEFKGELIQSIRINYGTDKNKINDYFVSLLSKNQFLLVIR